LKKLDRKRKRIYRKERRSEKWRNLDKLFKQEIKEAKADFYKKAVAELKLKKPSQWYCCLKKITTHDQDQHDDLVVDEISHLDNKSQAELIADRFSAVQNEYDYINPADIQFKDFLQVKSLNFLRLKYGLHWQDLTQANQQSQGISQLNCLRYLRHTWLSL